MYISVCMIVVSPVCKKGYGQLHGVEVLGVCFAACSAVFMFFFFSSLFPSCAQPSVVVGEGG